MKRGVCIFLKMTIILLTLGIFVEVQGQPVQVTEVPSNSSSFIRIGDLVYFTDGDALWRTDGTKAGTILLKSGFNQLRFYCPCASVWFTEFNGMAIFYYARRVPGNWHADQELWRSDGTPEGTILLASYKGAGIELRITDEKTPKYLFFRAYEAATGVKLYRTDGTASGTVIVNPSVTYIAGDDAVVGDYLFFAGRTAEHGRELWKTDGTSSGTVLVKDIKPGPLDGFYGNVFSYNNLFYFNGHTAENGTEPWVSDGTPENTILLTETKPGATNAEIYFNIGNDGLVHFHFTTYPDSYGAPKYTELWKTNGSPSTTVRYKSLIEETYYEAYEPVRYLSNFLVYKDAIYFTTSYDGNVELWRTDGTEGGTINFRSYPMVFNERGYLGYVPFFKVVNDHILFYINDQGFSSTFYRTDGTSSGTQSFAHFNVTAYGNCFDCAGPRSVTKVKDLVFYADHIEPASSDISMNNYFQLIQADGFTARAVRDIHGGSYIGTANIVDFNGKVLFTTLNDHPESTDTTKRLWIYDPAQPAEPVAHFTLVNADTDEDIQMLREGDVFAKPAGMSINIRYNPVTTIRSVVFRHNDKIVRADGAAPYALAGDRSGDYFPWTNATPGDHKVEATPYGPPGPTLTINFRIEETGEEAAFSQINIYPNPAQSSDPELTIAGYEGIKETIETDVEIRSMTGNVVFSERISCGGDCNAYLMKVNEQLVPGVYLVNLKSNGVRYSKRLLVK